VQLGVISKDLIQSTVNFHGIELSLITHAEDKVLGAMFRNEQPLCPQFNAELKLLLAQIRPGYRILDAGANIGSVAIALAKKEPSAVIYCFEPDPLNYSLLILNIMLNKIDNILSFPFALGGKRKSTQLYKSDNNYGDHRTYKPMDKYTSRNETFSMHNTIIEQVNPVTFLKKIMRIRSVPQIDMLKIDTQGADIDILSACLPLLREGAEVAIEFSPYHLYQFGSNYDVVRATLSQFRSVNKIKQDSDTLYESLNMRELKEYYDNKYMKYSGYMDLFMIK